MKFREIEEIILNDGWVFKNAKGSRYQYTHPAKPGKVTIPCHAGVIVRSILKQAGA
jgi:predicted RNA binding protein YcfA (HicA-like mRNA interferase family)